MLSLFILLKLSFFALSLVIPVKFIHNLSGGWSGYAPLEILPGTTTPPFKFFL